MNQQDHDITSSRSNLVGFGTLPYQVSTGVEGRSRGKKRTSPHIISSARDSPECCKSHCQLVGPNPPVGLVENEIRKDLAISKSRNPCFYGLKRPR